MRLSQKLDLLAAAVEGRGGLPPLTVLAAGDLARVAHVAHGGAAGSYLFEAGSELNSPWNSTLPARSGRNFIGAQSYMNGGGYLRDDVHIGRFCSIGRRVTIGARRHDLDGLSTSPRLPGLRRTDGQGRVLIGSDVWIGDGAVVLPGLNLGTGSVLGANAVLTRDAVPYGIYGGVPARLIRRRFPDALCEELLASRWWDRPLDLLRSLPRSGVEAALAALAAAPPDAWSDEPTYVVEAGEGGRG